MGLIRTCVLVLGAGWRAGFGQAVPATAPATVAGTALAAAADVQVTLSTAVEDGKKQLIATVKRGGKPVENATVSFGAKRTFGRLVLGTDVTLDDGTAAVPFPADLPGDAQGNLELSAMVQGPLSQWGASASATLPGGRPKEPPVDSFPRALWSPSAPVGLIGAIAILVGGAWAAYLFVAFQLMAIRKGASE